MPVTAKVVVSLAGLAVVGSGVALWTNFGAVILFDMASAAFIACF